VKADQNLALLTDLYQLTMSQSYFQSGRLAPASFSLFVRAYPPNRGYFVAAGLSDVLDFLEEFSFDSGSIDFLHSKQMFTDDFLDYLKGMRFTGDVSAIPEGRVFFRDEPILELTAPVIEAQIVETFIINQINLQTLIATKAARCVYAARGRAVVDFSLRRTHGIDAGMKVARASYLAGFAGTSNVLAGGQYGIPIVGTMAHSFVSSFDRESDAFRTFVESFPNNSTLLIDTYDTLSAARKAVEIAREMAAKGQRLQGVRIDSGDLPTLAFEVRRLFDAAGLNNVKIVASGGLDEYDLEQFSENCVPFDSYGVGTRMGVSADAPWLDIAYKLVEYNRRPVLKLSTGKASWPGRKQVYRIRNEEGKLDKDMITLANETVTAGEPLLQKALQGGKRTSRAPSLEDSRSVLADELGRVPGAVKKIHSPAEYPVEFSLKLKELREQVERALTLPSPSGRGLR
jgi:nicotinate phosphoribosyltransferase